MKRSGKWNSKLTVGLLISNISDIYTRQVWPGVVDALKNKDVNLIIFSGNPLFSKSSMLYKHYGQSFSQQPFSSYDYQSNIMYELADQNNVDALIMTTGSLSHGLNNEELAKFHKRLESMKLVSIAIQLDGVPSVLVDNKKGMKDMVSHLIDVHGYQKIGFIRGPENHKEAQERFHAYLEALEDHHISVDEKLIYQGDFMWHSGIDAAKELLETRNAKFEAVVAANDSMAISAMNYFQSKGLRIPQDIALGGFDNIELTKYSMTPLSTVKQPFYQQAQKAAEMVVDLLEGRDVPETVILPTEFIARASCGCLPESIELNDKDGGRKAVPVNPLYQSAPIAHGVNVSGAQRDEANLSSEEMDELSAAFLETVVQKKSSHDLLYSINEMILSFYKTGRDVQKLLAALTRIKNSVINQFAEMEDIIRCETLYQNVIIFIEEKIQIIPGMKLIDYINSDSQLISVIQGILSKIQINELLDIIATELPKLNIPGCYISLYEKEWRHENIDEWKIPGEIEIAMAFNKDGRVDLTAVNKKFKITELIPKELYDSERSFVWVAEALYFAEEQLGLILFELGNTEGMVYELLRLQISNSIKGSLLLYQQQKTQKELQAHIQIMDSELDLARKIQYKLIPNSTPWPDISFYYRPMAKVGGDFFDFIKYRNPDLVGVFISDVSGHGVPAALITSMIKTTLLQTASSSNSPAQILRQLNNILITQSADNFITAFYGIYNRQNRELVYSFAGHNAPYIITADKILCLPSESKALPLAMLENKDLKSLQREYINQKITLSKNSKLLLYTDGLTETVNIVEKMNSPHRFLKDFEMAELTQVIEETRDLPSKEFIDRMAQKLHHFRGSDDFEDDVCMICIDIK